MRLKSNWIRVEKGSWWARTSFALGHVGHKRVHDAAEMMAAIVGREIVDHFEREGFVIMAKPPIGGAAALGRGHAG